MTQVSDVMRLKIAVLPFFVAVSVALPVYAKQNRTIASNELIGAVTRCRDIQADVARLTCFDAASATLAAAGEVAVVSREDVAQNQRRLFGFNVSALNPFENSGQSESLQSISATMTSARSLGRGEWVITLDDGSVWRKTDGVGTLFSANRQYPVTVRRAALGSYMMRVANDPPFRVRRE